MARVTSCPAVTTSAGFELCNPWWAGGVGLLTNHVDHGAGASFADEALSSVCTRSTQVCIVWCNEAEKLELLEAESHDLIYCM